MEIHCVAAMTYGAYRVQPIFHESDAQPANHWMNRKLARLHFSNSFGFQDCDSVHAAVLKKCKHEARHVGGGG